MPATRPGPLTHWGSPGSACRRSSAGTASHHDGLGDNEVGGDRHFGCPPGCPDQAPPGSNGWRAACSISCGRPLIMTLRRWLLVVVTAFGAGGGLLVGLPACNTPFIPLPPPADPTFTPIAVSDGMGGTRMMWQTSGAPSAAMVEAKVTVYNATVGAGVIVRAQTDGSYVASPI